MRVKENNRIYDESEIRELALRYYDLVRQNQRESLPPIRAKIWASIWYIRNDIYRFDSLRKYKAFSENGFNSCGPSDEYNFLDNVFLDNIVSIIDSFCTEGIILRYDSNFMRYFVGVFTKKVSRAASDIIYRNPQNFRWVKLRNNVNEAFMYAEASENTRIEDYLPPVTSHDVMKRYISQRLSEDGEWYYIESKQHGRQVYVRACDFELIEPVINYAIDDTRQPAYGHDNIQCDNDSHTDFPEDGLTNKYTLSLLATVQMFYQESHRTLNDNIAINSLGRLQCYKLLYTETMTNLLKLIYQNGWELVSDDEALAINVADPDLIDYILVASGCRTFISIARTRLKSLYEITQRAGDSDDELGFPIPSYVYYCYLSIVRGLQINKNSVIARISRYRSLFKEQLGLICNVR